MKDKNTAPYPIIIFYALTTLTILCLSVFAYILLFTNNNNAIKIIGAVTALLLIILWLIYELRFHGRNKTHRTVSYTSEVSRFVLINTECGREKEWHVSGHRGFLIGKGTLNSQVDIELGDSHYSGYVSNEHAALNFSGGYWYLEDLNSTNGVGIKKAGEEYALRLKPEVLYKIDVGDIIYVSKAKIVVM